MVSQDSQDHRMNNHSRLNQRQCDSTMVILHYNSTMVSEHRMLLTDILFDLHIFLRYFALTTHRHTEAEFDEPTA